MGEIFNLRFERLVIPLYTNVEVVEVGVAEVTITPLMVFSAPKLGMLCKH